MEFDLCLTNERVKIWLWLMVPAFILSIALFIYLPGELSLAGASPLIIGYVIYLRWVMVKRLKSKIGILILACIVVSAGFWYIQQEINQGEDMAINPEVSNVVHEVSDKYQVQYTSIMNGGKNSTIKINVYDKNNVPEVENYLKNNLSGDDLEQYEVDVFYNDEH